MHLSQAWVAVPGLARRDLSRVHEVLPSLPGEITPPRHARHRFGTYRLADPATNSHVAWGSPNAYDLSLDEIERALTDPKGDADA